MSDWSEAEVNADMNNAVRNSEFEIWSEAVGGPDVEEVEGNRSLMDQNELIEGADGEPMTNYAAMNGEILGGYGGTSGDAAELAAALSQERAQRVAAEQQRDSLITAPLMAQEREAQRERERDYMFKEYGYVPTDDAQHDKFMRDVRGLLQENQARRNYHRDSSIRNARQKYGEDFDRAFDSVYHMDPRNPVAKALAAQIDGAENPGEAIMQLGTHSEITGALRQQGAPPFMPETYRRAFGPARPQVNYSALSRGHGSGGWGEEPDYQPRSEVAREEEHVFNAIWDNY
jgi:hypothetical protein